MTRMKMHRRALITVGLAAVAPALSLAVTAGAPAPAVASSSPVAHAGPPYSFTTELMIEGVQPLKDAAALSRTEHGYRLRAGQQNSRLTVTEVARGIKFVDRGTRKWVELAPACTRLKVDRGVAAVCPKPAGASATRPVLLEIWPRLGDDHVDGSKLSAQISMAVLGDAGRDVIKLGAGRDFANGASGKDVIRGGGGHDWLRGGPDADRMYAGGGDDYVVGQDGADAIFGGKGNDRLASGNHNDRVLPGPGRDAAQCGPGSDEAAAESGESLRDCEKVFRR